MTDHRPETAPELGAPTDAAVDGEVASTLLRGTRPSAGDAQPDEARPDDDERTMATPDALGGTGGTQAGGAG